MAQDLTPILGQLRVGFFRFERILGYYSRACHILQMEVFRSPRILPGLKALLISRGLTPVCPLPKPTSLFSKDPITSLTATGEAI